MGLEAKRGGVPAPMVWATTEALMDFMKFKRLPRFAPA